MSFFSHTSINQACSVLPTRTEVPSLYNEPLHDAMDGCIQVVQRFERVPSLSLLSGAETPEVLHRLRTYIAEEFEDDPTSWIQYNYPDMKISRTRWLSTH